MTGGATSGDHARLGSCKRLAERVDASWDAAVASLDVEVSRLSRLCQQRTGACSGSSRRMGSRHWWSSSRRGRVSAMFDEASACAGSRGFVVGWGSLRGFSLF